jgi:hypothetical protein
VHQIFRRNSLIAGNAQGLQDADAYSPRTASCIC